MFITSLKIIKKLIYNPLLQSSGLLATEKLVRLVANIFVLALVARYLGPERFGLLSLMLLALGLALPVFMLGLQKIVVREFIKARNPYELQETFSTALYLRICISVFGWVLVSVALFVVDFELGLAASILYSALVFHSFDVIEHYQQSISKLQIVFYARIAATMVSAIAKITLVVLDAELDMFVVAAWLDFSIFAVYLLLLFVRSKPPLSLNPRYFRLTTAVTLIKESWVEIFAAIAGIALLRIDQVMVNQYLGNEALGVYSVASRMTEAWYFVPMAIIAGFFPYVLRGQDISDEEYGSRLQALMSIMLVVSISAALLFSICGDGIIRLLFGESFLEAAEVLVVLAWSGCFMCIGLLSGSALTAERKLKFNTMRNILGLLVNLLLNHLLLPIYGIIGAAWATLIALSTSYLFFDLLFPATRHHFVIKLRSLSGIQLAKSLKKF